MSVSTIPHNNRESITRSYALFSYASIHNPPRVMCQVRHPGEDEGNRSHGTPHPSTNDHRSVANCSRVFPKHFSNISVTGERSRAGDEQHFFGPNLLPDFGTSPHFRGLIMQ